MHVRPITTDSVFQWKSLRKEQIIHNSGKLKKMAELVILVLLVAILLSPLVIFHHHAFSILNRTILHDYQKLSF